VGASTGTLTAQDNAQITAGRIWVGKDNNASGVFTITNDATVVSMNDLTMAIYWNGTAVTPSNAIVNLAGGSLAVSSVHGNTNGTSGTFNFNGGTLIARNPGTPNFMFDLASINVMSGGATIDSGTNNIAIAEPLLDAGGGGGLTKLGSGALYLNGANTYTGPTLVNEGALGGTGSIVSPVTVAAGGSLAPATSIGTLTINNTLSLAGTAVMEITRDNGTPESDRVVGVSTLTYGGTLTVTNIGTNSLQVGDTFDLFDAATINPANFAQLNLPAGYTWDTSQLNVNGTISVESIAPEQPEFDSPVFSDGDLVLGGTGGTPGGTYYLLSTTNVALPVSSWTRVSTNVFDGSGNFSLTNAIIPATPRLFYQIELGTGVAAE
jgi:autotransporter-associated beta strand protein